MAEEFLETGKATGADAPTLARDCSAAVRRETERSSERAIVMARDFVKHSRSLGGVMLQTAYRALGWASLVGGKYPQAERSYLKAREMLRRDATMRARIDRVLIDVYMYLGDLKEARRRSRQALKTFERLGAEDDLAKTRVNYANLLHRQDRHSEAQELYHQAGEHFRSRKADLPAAFCFHNEANTLVQLFDFKSAYTLYRESEKVFATHGHDLRALGCRYGLAWLHMLEGDYHVALEELAVCESDYEKASQARETLLCRLDRAEAYLGLNLFADAGRAARDAHALAKKLGVRYEGAKASFFLAKSSIAMGRTAEARRALKKAATAFSDERNVAFLAAVEIASLQIGDETATPAARIGAARRAFSRAQLPLWEAICDLQILSGRPGDRVALRRLAENPAVQTVPHLHARWHTMQGDLKAEKGATREAIDHWTHACETLDAVRAKLPPVDMRTAFLRNQGDPHCRLIDAELNRDPISAAAWSERYKTAGLWRAQGEAPASHVIRERAERSLSELASQVTALSSRIEGVGRRAEATTRSGEAFLAMQERVRHDLAGLRLETGATVDAVDEVRRQIRSAARGRTVIQFHAGGDDLVVFVHTGKKTSFHRYPDGVRTAREFMGRWRLLVERAAFVTGGRGQADTRDEREFLAQAGEWILAPLDLPPGPGRLLILPEGGAANFPWSALVFGGESLADQYELVLSPSVRHFLHARDTRVRSDRIEIFVGESDGLSGTSRECEALTAVAKGKVAVHAPCYRRDWPSGKSARVWHYAGHAQLRGDNPFYSSLTVADGPMFAADFQLRQNRVGLVTLAACRTGQQAFLPGEESTGLVRSFLEMGARSVLAGSWAISDETTSAYMQEFYRRHLAGKPVAAAARETALHIRDTYPSAYHWAAFSVHGYGG